MKKLILLLFVAISFFYHCKDDTTITTPFEAKISSNLLTIIVTEKATTAITYTQTLSTINTSGSAIKVTLDFKGTATRGVDYKVSDTTITFAKDGDTGSITITILDDDDDEEDETIIIGVKSTSLPTGITLNETEITLTINDNNKNEVCPNDNTTNHQAHAFENAAPTNEYSAKIENGKRIITTNGLPNHGYTNKTPNTITGTTRTYEVTSTPQLASAITTVTSGGRPLYSFGVATNGIKIDPAPATPFIFENTETGEYNWDWVLEPTNNLNAVGLDEAIAHVQPDGTYHYHGDMVVFAEILKPGVKANGISAITDKNPILIGWAGDGYPIIYKYGNNASNQFVELKSSYQLKAGERTGDGISEPCGEYNGKYTNDYEYKSGSGDLDECNGMKKSITINGETFDYFYVITSAFPVIPRCFKGTPGTGFKLGGGTNTGGTTGGGTTGPKTYKINVTANGSSNYVFTGDFPGNDTEISIMEPDTIIFTVKAAGHPFWIKTKQTTGKGDAVTPDIVNNGTTDGIIKWSPGRDKSGTYFYICEFHSAMTNKIIVTKPSPPGGGRVSSDGRK